MMQFDRSAEDVGNIVSLEHVNTEIPDQHLARVIPEHLDQWGRAGSALLLEPGERRRFQQAKANEQPDSDQQSRVYEGQDFLGV